jgi:acetylornithine deacetylase/succinyl-diaminopimelate desuccinylase-like protein
LGCAEFPQLDPKMLPAVRIMPPYRQPSMAKTMTAHQQQYLRDLIDFLRIPSISTDEGSAGEVNRAAAWVADRLKRAGMENVEILPTGIHSCVYGDWLHAPGTPTVLIYGHFDVQPADPLGLWHRPPFEPAIKEGRIYARGASDMKGNLLLSVIGVETLLESNGALPVNVKFIFEGQEEIGSRDLGPFVAANRDRLACDLALSADGLQWTETQAAIFLAVKGMCALQVDIETAQMDLHSGLYGGAVPNAVHAMIELLGTMRDHDGRIRIEGFYDRVVALSETEKAAIDAVPFDPDGYQLAIGVQALVGEPGYSTYERTWTRPTLEINGIWGGYQGDGVKTVVPARCHAKITCRLVADQDPDFVLDRVEAHLASHGPPGARVSVTRHGAKARAYRVPIDHPGVQAVADVLTESYGRPPYFVGIGGSLPITDMFLRELNAYTVMVGFSLDDECVHSPNEFMRLASFERGAAVYVRLLRRLCGMDARNVAARQVSARESRT